MLKLTNTGVEVTLIGKPHTDGNFVMVCMLLVGAVAVAVAMATLGVQYAIFALFALACGCFAFNVYRQRQKTNAPLIITSGVVIAEPFCLTYNGQTIELSKEFDIDGDDDHFMILDNGTEVAVLAGFETAKECQVVKSVLSGASINKKFTNIKLQG